MPILSSIKQINAYALRISTNIDMLGVRQSIQSHICLVEIETQSGITGWGMTGITQVSVIAYAINKVVAPALLGDDALAHEHIWDKLYWLLSPRGQTGYASHIMAAIDIALWDIKGKVLDRPIWQLLGGARTRVPVYATFGLEFWTREQLAEAAKLWVADGYRKLKMKVADKALRDRNTMSLDDVIKEDVARVSAVREAVGDAVDLYIDANCNLDFLHAVKLAQQLEPFNITFFEEPITQNDVRQLAKMRQQTSIPLAVGQNEGLAFRFRDFLIHEAVDVIQPNVVITGGYTQCAKIAGMASAFNVPIDNGGAWPFHNMHLHGGVANGGLVEMHYISVECVRAVFDGLPEAADGWLPLPESPGLGFSPNWDKMQEYILAE